MVFRFLDLPAELRNPVYEYLLTIDEVSKQTWPQLLAVSGAIRKEATSILYGPENKLIVSLTGAKHHTGTQDDYDYTHLDEARARRQDDQDGADVVIGNRPSFWARAPSMSVGGIAEGMIETVRRWPRDLSQVKFVEIQRRAWERHAPRVCPSTAPHSRLVAS